MSIKLNDVNMQRIKENRRSVMFIALVMVLAMACSPQPVYEQYRPIGSDGWGKDSLEKFTFSIEDTLQSYNVKMNIRNQGNYAFSNLWMFVDIVSPDSTAMRDTVEFELAKPSGEWYGRGIGDLFDAQYLYRSNVRFPQKGEYTIVLQQGMRDDHLKGIHDIGLRIEKH